MSKKLPYHSHLSYEEIECFLKQTIYKRFGTNTPILICRWRYKTKTEINFWIQVKERGRKDDQPVLCVAYIEDFRFRIVIKNSNRDYTEQWAQYLCDSLKFKLEDFDDKAYKAEYNKYWNRTKRTKATDKKQEDTSKLSV